MAQNDNTAASIRTKVLLAVYLAAFLASAVFFVLIVGLIALVALRHEPYFKIHAWPYGPLSVLTMFMAKAAARWSYKEDRRQAHR